MLLLHQSTIEHTWETSWRIAQTMATPPTFHPTRNPIDEGRRTTRRDNTCLKLHMQMRFMLCRRVEWCSPLSRLFDAGKIAESDFHLSGFRLNCVRARSSDAECGWLRLKTVLADAFAKWESVLCFNLSYFLETIWSSWKHCMSFVDRLPCC